MNHISKTSLFLKTYSPMFLLLCFSGNPIFTAREYSKELLIFYTVSLLVYTLYFIKSNTLKKISAIIAIIALLIAIITSFQKIILGYVSYPGVFSFFIKTLIGLSTVIHYQTKKIDFLDVYIKTIFSLAVISIPFWIINLFGFYGIPLGEDNIKSFLIYTSLMPHQDWIVARNSGMFWEPGAFSGYLILAFIFIIIKNRKFRVGNYRKEVVFIFFGLLTTISTTGFIVFGTIIIIYSLQNFQFGKLIIVPLFIIVFSFTYNNLSFLSEKINNQYSNAINMKQSDVSNSRFGALNMDLQYIKSQPIIGNGLHVKTRYRFHPGVKGDIGHGNGMSNFIACWGIPLFLFWSFCVFKFALNVSHSSSIAILSLLLTILLLQGEQFLNYPLFLSFFILPFVYSNTMTYKDKVYLIKSYLNIS